MQQLPTKLPTVRLKHPKTKEVRTISRIEYNRRSAKYSAWIVVGFDEVGVKQASVDHMIAELDAEQKRLQKPGHISRGDEERRYNGRIIQVTGETAEAIAAQARRV